MAPGDRRHAGMTLVEILVALSVSTLILSAAVLVYRTITGSLRRQQSSHQEPAYSALEQLRQDLVQSAQVPSTNLPAFILESQSSGSNTPQISSLAFSVGNLPAPEAGFSSLEVSRIRYNLILMDADTEGWLVRETMSLWGSNALSPAVSNTILDHVTAFEVSVLTDTGWTNTWSSSSRSLVPRAARLRLDWRTDASLETARMEVFIPVGNLVPSGKAKR
jgi:type II secretion system protein J